MLELYTREAHCPWCDKAKKLLTENGMTYKEIVVGRDMLVEVFREFIGTQRATVPQLFVDGVHIGGYESVEKYINMKKAAIHNG